MGEFALKRRIFEWWFVVFLNENVKEHSLVRKIYLHKDLSIILFNYSH